jgi:hypothetical protein
MRRLLLPLLAVLAAALAAPAAAPASSRQVVSFEAPRELLSDASRDATLDEIRAFGVTRIRQLVYWKAFAPSPNARRRPSFDAANPDAYPAGTWDRLDRLVQAAAARQIGVQLTLTGPVPRWATKARKDDLTSPSPTEFGRFATAVGRRYGGQISMWSIWNEPNQPQFLLPQYRKGRPVSPPLYRKLYLAAVKGLRRTPANARDTILLGETSPRGNSHVVRPLTFLRGVLCLDRRYKRTKRCAKLPADGYAHHAYTTSQGPRFVPPSPDDVTIGVLPRLVRALDRAAKAGALPRRLPIYLTEFGIQSYPDRIAGVPQARQAAYIAISEHIAYVNARVAAFSQYLMADDPRTVNGERFGGFESGLKTASGKVKPAYAAFRLPLAVESYGRRDVLWGLVRPDRAKTSVQILVASAKGAFKPLRTVTTNSTGVYGASVRHKQGRRYKVRWTAPDGRVFEGAAITAS